MAAYFVLTLVVGFAIPVHVSMNSRAGGLSGSPSTANILFWVAGLLMSIALAVPGLAKDGNVFSGMGKVPWPLWLAGALGACISLAISVAMPRLGAANATFLMLLGQMVASAFLSDRGLLGSPKDPISVWKIVGILVMTAGAALFVFAPPRR